VGKYDNENLKVKQGKLISACTFPASSRNNLVPHVTFILSKYTRWSARDNGKGRRFLFIIQKIQHAFIIIHNF
jgi:hypothetical protein